jgi:hypothetical protein
MVREKRGKKSAWRSDGERGVMLACLTRTGKLFPGAIVKCWCVETGG